MNVFNKEDNTAKFSSCVTAIINLLPNCLKAPKIDILDISWQDIDIYVY